MITEKDLNQFCENITNCPICNNQIKKYISDKNIKYVYCDNGKIYKDVNVADSCFVLNNRIFEENLVSIKLERYIMLSSKILDFRYNIYKKSIIFIQVLSQLILKKNL